MNNKNPLNRLNGSRCYLAGPMDRIVDRGIGWRRMITPRLQDLGIIVLDPSNKPITCALEDAKSIKLRHNMLVGGNYKYLVKQMKEIRHIDLRMVDIGDFLIVNWDTNVHMCGTLEEVFSANRQKKPILIRCEQGKVNMPDWMFGVLPHEYFFDTWDNILEYLIKVQSHKSSMFDGRWIHFNYNEIH